MTRSVNQSTGYGPLARELARQAMQAARDAAPHASRAGQWQRSLTLGLPAARALMGEPQDGDRPAFEMSLDALTEASRGIQQGDSPRFTDGFGHSRPIYHLLLLHLHMALVQQPDTVSLASSQFISRLGDSLAPFHDYLVRGTSTVEPTLQLWTALCVKQHAALGKTENASDPHLSYLEVAADTTVEAILAAPGSDGSLRQQGYDEPFDEWTYRELVGLHALDRLAAFTGGRDWRQRVDEAAAYHQFHTQPDYTTYQPWAFAAFAARRETSMFAEQQLHDVTVHLQTGGPAAALVPTLLLADATARLSND